MGNIDGDFAPLSCCIVSGCLAADSAGQRGVDPQRGRLVLQLQGRARSHFTL